MLKIFSHSQRAIAAQLGSSNSGIITPILKSSVCTVIKLVAAKPQLGFKTPAPSKADR